MKRLLTLALAALVALPLAAGPARAYSQEQEDAADALYHLELFLGTGAGYELDRTMTRVEGVTLLVRMLGLEDEAKETTQQPFQDVDGWAEGYVGCAWSHGLTNGVSSVRFGSTEALSQGMFLTMTLRALGYADTGAGADFTWDAPYKLAVSAGLVDTQEPDGDFTRGDAVMVFWNALNARLKGGDTTLAERLIDQKAFTRADFAQAGKLAQGERLENEEEPSGSNSGNSNVIPPTQTPEPDTEKKPADYTWEEYLAMTPAQQEAHYLSFDSVSAYFQWRNKALQEYEDNKTVIEVGPDTEVDLGELFGQ